METETILLIAAGFYFTIGLIIAFAVAIDMITDMSVDVKSGTDGCAAIFAVLIMFFLTLYFWIFLIPAVKISRKYGKKQ